MVLEDERNDKTDESAVRSGPTRGIPRLLWPGCPRQGRLASVAHVARVLFGLGTQWSVQGGNGCDPGAPGWGRITLLLWLSVARSMLDCRMRVRHMARLAKSEPGADSRTNNLSDLMKKDGNE